MISLHTWATPNGRKVSILLEELGLDYQVQPVNLGKGEQFAPAFLAISPNNKVPALVDDSTGTALFESGAILTYLAEQHGRFLATTGPARYQALAWLHWQVGGLGPMLGQLAYYEKFASEKDPVASARFLAEADRLLIVLDKQLASHTWLAGDDYSIADIAVYPWVITATHFLGDVLGPRMETKPALRRWLALVGARPAVQRGMAIPAV